MSSQEYNIPTPDSGYWSKLKFGKKVEIISLPIDIKVEGLISFQEREKNSATKKSKSDSKTSINIETPDVLTKPTKLVSNAQKGFILNSKRYGSRYGMYGTGENNLNIYVTHNCLNRALRIFDLVIKLLERKGFQVKANGHGTVALIEDIRIPIRIREKNNRKIKKEQKYSWTEYDYFPSGSLVFTVELRSWRRKEIFDTTYSRLEDKIEKIVEEIINQGINEKKYRIQCEIHRKEEKVRKEQEEIRIKNINAELEKFKAILVNKERWNKANIIRNYLNEYERHFLAKNELDDDKKSWLGWARKKADWYDPFIEREDEFLEGIDRDKLEALSSKYYF